jgi:transposase-like protein
MKVKTRKRYTPEFKAQVLELLELGNSGIPARQTELRQCNCREQAQPY